MHALRRLTKKCKTPKANGNFHSWKRNQKATSALKWALRHASYITLNRLENVAVDDSIDEAMAEVKSSLGKFFDEMKEKGKVDECDADVMPLELYHLLCAEFLKRGMFLAWAWLTSGWNHVCRHDNIKSMAFHMFNITSDSIRTEFDRTKTSTSDSRMASSASNPKHVFANIVEPEMCPFLSMGFWLALMRDHDAAPATEKTQVFPRSKAAHQVFERDLALVLADPSLTVALAGLGITASHRISSHSTRKGAATTLASADCNGGYLVAICRRGDWAITTVLDAYLKCTVGGDQTLGRILAGLNPNSAEFDVLPPHFLAGNEDLVKRALDLVFGCADGAIHKLEEGRFQPIVQRLLASVVYHHDWLVACADRYDEDAGSVGVVRDVGPLTLKNVVQVVFPGRVASYTVEQRELFMDTVRCELVARAEAMLQTHIIETTMYDVHADLSMGVAMKVCMKINSCISPFEVRAVRRNIEFDPMCIRVEGETTTSIGSVLRRSTRIRIALPRSHKVFRLILFQDVDFLREMKAIVSVEESSVIQRATGVPGMVYLRKDFGDFATQINRRMEMFGTALNSIDGSMQVMQRELSQRSEEVSAAVVAKIDETYTERASRTARDAGQVHNETLKRTLTEEMDKRDKKLQKTMRDVQRTLRALAAGAQAHAAREPNLNDMFEVHLEPESEEDDIDEDEDLDEDEDMPREMVRRRSAIGVGGDVEVVRTEGDIDVDEDNEDEEEEDEPAIRRNRRPRGGAHVAAIFRGHAPRIDADAALMDANYEACAGPHWTRSGKHYHRSGEGAGASWATPENYTLEVSMSLRHMVHLYLNGDGTNQIMPLRLVTREGLVTLREKNRLSKTHAFFVYMASLLLLEGERGEAVVEFPSATRTRRLKVSVLDGIMDNIRTRLTQAPFEFLASRKGRSRDGHGEEGASVSFGSMSSFCRCVMIMKHGTEQDKRKLREMRGCHGHTNGKGCKACRAFV